MLSARRALAGVELDAHRVVQVLEEGAVAAGGLQHPAGVVAQAQHAAHDGFRGEHLAEGFQGRRSGGGAREDGIGFGAGRGPAIVPEAGETGQPRPS
jgi:hypothetical protein